jgi:murein DD-endopeptidase MepM/ murein hydrolase activator NlpD
MGGAPQGMQQVSLTGVRSYIGALAVPVQGSRFTSPFGWRWNKFHEGADLAAPQGTKVVAAHSGTVVMASQSFYGYGRTVVLKGDGLLTVYAHNSTNRVSVGDTVQKGEWIADVGQTGSASGPHVHFETRVQDSSGRYAAVDPTVFYPENP